MKKIALTSLVCLTAAAGQLYANADANAKGSGSQPTMSTKKTPCTDEANRSMRVGLRHIEAKGIGYHDGYTTLEGYFGFDPNSYEYMPFIDVRGHVFNNGEWAANAGLGFRTLQGCWIWGLNAYYDYRQGHHHNSHHYNAVGAGIEFMNKSWELRANGDFVVGDRHNALDTASAEVAYHFWESKHWDFLGGVGPYYLWGHSDHNNAWGGEARLYALFNNWLSLEVSYSCDSLFHSIVQGELGLYLPFGPRGKKTPTKSSCSSCSDMMDLNDRLVQAVRRIEIIPVKHHDHHHHHHHHHEHHDDDCGCSD